MSLKRLRFLLFFLALVAVTLSYQALSDTKLADRLNFLAEPVYFINDGISAIISSLSGRRSPELTRLKEEALRLKTENMKLKEEAAEAARLRELLLLKEQTFGLVTFARVTARGGDPWLKTVTIDKGSKDFIEKGMAVITPNGLLGKVHRVYDSYSLVLLADDEKFRAAARLQASRTEGIYSGTGSRKGALRYVDSKAELGEAEVLVTSGLDGVFPPGISIGYVSRVSRPEGKLFQDIEVTLFADTSNVEEVAVLR